MAHLREKYFLQVKNICPRLKEKYFLPIKNIFPSDVLVFPSDVLALAKNQYINQVQVRLKKICPRLTDKFCPSDVDKFFSDVLALDLYTSFIASASTSEGQKFVRQTWTNFCQTSNIFPYKTSPKNKN